jgi:hypothetical protein
MLRMKAANRNQEVRKGQSELRHRVRTFWAGWLGMHPVLCSLFAGHYKRISASAAPTTASPNSAALATETNYQQRDKSAVSRSPDKLAGTIAAICLVRFNNDGKLAMSISLRALSSLRCPNDSLCCHILVVCHMRGGRENRLPQS